MHVLSQAGRIAAPGRQYHARPIARQPGIRSRRGGALSRHRRHTMPLRNPVVVTTRRSVTDGRPTAWQKLASSAVRRRPLGPDV